jgi:hypothetical protein
MAYAIDEFYDHPKPNEANCYEPLLSHGPEEAPQAERYERDIKNNEAACAILRYEATHESSGREDIVEASHILLNRVSSLRRNKGDERKLESRHGSAHPPNYFYRTELK